MFRLFKKNRKPSTQATEQTITWHVPGGQVMNLSKAVFEDVHTLIAGTTGAGKSVLLNGLLRDFLRLYAPCEAGLMLIDPKQLELDYLRKLPHCEGYADTHEGALALLENALEIMNLRNRYCKENGLRSYPGKALYIIIDELHPLATGKYKAKFRQTLSLLLTQARAANIHVIALTQIPNRAALPADIVSLFTFRIGLHTLSPIESRQIIGVKGCEALPKHGTAYVLRGGELLTTHIPMTDYDEVQELINYWSSPAAIAA